MSNRQYMSQEENEQAASFAAKHPELTQDSWNGTTYFQHLGSIVAEHNWPVTETNLESALIIAQSRNLIPSQNYQVQEPQSQPSTESYPSYVVPEHQQLIREFVEAHPEVETSPEDIAANSANIIALFEEKGWPLDREHLEAGLSRLKATRTLNPAAVAEKQKQEAKDTAKETETIAPDGSPWKVDSQKETYSNGVTTVSKISLNEWIRTAPRAEVDRYMAMEKEKQDRELKYGAR